MHIILAIIGFGFLVLVHEFGHYFLARLNGVHVEEFSIGMGPTLISKQGKETKWSIKALPIGGACQMKGEATGDPNEDHDSFQSKGTLQKMSIIIAGPLMNIITAFLLFAILANVTGFPTTKINEVTPNLPAYTAGIAPGDIITKINGKNVAAFQDLSMAILTSEGKEVTVTVDRNGNLKDLVIKPVLNEETKGYVLGVRPEFVQNPNFIDSVKEGSRMLNTFLRGTIDSLKILFTGRAKLDQVGGPLVVIGMASKASQSGFSTLIKFLAIISISLGIFNLLPFPALDGGWLFILLIELITRKKLPEKFVAIWNTIGFILLMGLMILVTFKDIFFPPNY